MVPILPLFPSFFWISTEDHDNEKKEPREGTNQEPVIRSVLLTVHTNQYFYHSFSSTLAYSDSVVSVQSVLLKKLLFP